VVGHGVAAAVVVAEDFEPNVLGEGVWNPVLFLFLAFKANLARPNSLSTILVTRFGKGQLQNILYGLFPSHSNTASLAFYSHDDLDIYNTVARDARCTSTD